MCGRTSLASDPEDLRAIFGLEETPHLEPHYNVPPSQPVAVVRVLRAQGGARTMDLLRWGLVPSWAEDPKIGHRLALARIETVATTPAFRDAVRRHRCLVVVDGFYEWHRSGANKKESHPFFARRADGAPFALAGVWDRWVAKDGEVVESCAILTQPARPPLDAVHDRMPLVLEKDAWAAWLDPQLRDPATLLEPRAADLVTYPVSPHVNDPRHDDPACTTPEEPAQRQLF
ncbi:MAG TPA: SOS response-associated peptidase [Polyangiaceae bacterium]|jgi:putative SOS response-associated peptidase YedK